MAETSHAPSVASESSTTRSIRPMEPPSVVCETYDALTALNPSKRCMFLNVELIIRAFNKATAMTHGLNAGEPTVRSALSRVDSDSDGEVTLPQFQAALTELSGSRSTPEMFALHLLSAAFAICFDMISDASSSGGSHCSPKAGGAKIKTLPRLVISEILESAVEYIRSESAQSPRQRRLQKIETTEVFASPKLIELLQRLPEQLDATLFSEVNLEAVHAGVPAFVIVTVIRRRIEEESPLRRPSFQKPKVPTTPPTDTSKALLGSQAANVLSGADELSPEPRETVAAEHTAAAAEDPEEASKRITRAAVNEAEKAWHQERRELRGRILQLEMHVKNLLKKCLQMTGGKWGATGDPLLESVPYTETFPQLISDRTKLRSEVAEVRAQMAVLQKERDEEMLEKNRIIAVLHQRVKYLEEKKNNAEAEAKARQSVEYLLNGFTARMEAVIHTESEAWGALREAAVLSRENIATKKLEMAQELQKKARSRQVENITMSVQLDEREQALGKARDELLEREAKFLHVQKRVEITALPEREKRLQRLKQLESMLAAKTTELDQRELQLAARIERFEKEKELYQSQNKVAMRKLQSVERERSAEREQQLNESAASLIQAEFERTLLEYNEKVSPTMMTRTAAVAGLDGPTDQSSSPSRRIFFW